MTEEDERQLTYEGDIVDEFSRMRTEEFIEDLRTLADVFERHLEVANHYRYRLNPMVAWVLGRKEEAESTLSAFVSMGLKETGHVDKIHNDDIIGGKFVLGNDIELKMMMTRDVVCEKKVVGKKVKRVPDPNWTPPEAPTVEVEEDVYEYDCKPMRKLDEAERLTQRNRDYKNGKFEIE